MSRFSLAQRQTADDDVTEHPVPNGTATANSAKSKQTILRCFFMFFVVYGFRNETRHKPVSDGRTYPNFGKEIFGVFIRRLKDNVDVIEYGNEHVDDENQIQVPLGVALPVFAGIEKSEHEKQQNRKSKAD